MLIHQFEMRFSFGQSIPRHTTYSGTASATLSCCIKSPVLLQFYASAPGLQTFFFSFYYPRTILGTGSNLFVPHDGVPLKNNSEQPDRGFIDEILPSLMRTKGNQDELRPC